MTATADRLPRGLRTPTIRRPGPDPARHAVYILTARLTVPSGSVRGVSSSAKARSDWSTVEKAADRQDAVSGKGSIDGNIKSTDD
jgi:hypothetical protein